MILFKNVKWKNFLSTGNVFTEVFLDKSANTLVVGENGSGKSTMLDALCFCLFSKPFRKISKPQLVNTINQKDCVVEVKFSIGSNNYRIVRGHAPRKMEIYLNDRELKPDAHIKDQQDYLEKNILKLNWHSFTQIVILGNASFTPFMQLTSMNRREIIEDLLDIKIFTAMNMLLREKLNSNKNNITDLKYKIEVEEEKLSMHRKNVEKLKTSNKEKIDNINEEIKKCERSIAEIELGLEKKYKLLDELKNKVKDEDIIKNKLNTIKDIESKYEERLRKLRKRINFYQENDHCPTCEQQIDETIKTKKIETNSKKIEEIRNASDKLDKELEKYNTKLLDMIEVNKKITSYDMEIATDGQEVSSITSYVVKLNKDLRLESKEGKDVKDELSLIKKIQSKVNSLNERRSELLHSKEVFDLASTLLKDSGIKTHIIKQYVPIINRLVNKYLATMEFFVNFELDENFNEVIKSRHRDEFSYSSFSEGEKMRIDLALMLTWRAIAKMKNSANTNLLILDEVFDASLDNDGCDAFLKLLYDLGNNSNVFVISHKGDILQDKFLSVIKFEKHKNFSRIAS